jgi:hypothetical protein
MLSGQNHNRMSSPSGSLRKAFPLILKNFMSPNKTRVRFRDQTIPMAFPSPIRRPNFLSSSPIACSGHYRINRVLRPTRIFRVDCDVLWSPLEWNLGDSIPQDALGDCATNPPTTGLRLTTTLLPWSIEVWPSQAVAYGEPYVSVLDIFKAIYNCMKTPVTEEEYNRNGGDGTYSFTYVLTKKATLAYHKRCQAFGMDTMRRVDYLMGRTHFKGLVPSATSPTDWEIIFD